MLRNQEASAFKLEKHLKSIEYHCHEAATALREAGEIAEWEFRSLDEGENIQYDREDEQGPSTYHLAVTIVLTIRDWANLTLANLKDEPAGKPAKISAPTTPTFLEKMGRAGMSFLKMIGATEDPEPQTEEDTDDVESLELIRDAADLLREFCKEKGDIDFRARIQTILGHMDDAEFSHGKTSSSGNTFLQIKDVINAHVKNITEALTNEDLEASLDEELQEKNPEGSERAEMVYTRIEDVGDQINLWKFQESCLKWRSRLEELTGVYFGTFNSSHGNFDDLLEEILPSEQVVEVDSMCLIFMQRVERMKGTIINGKERMDIILNFTALVQAHNDKVVFIERMEDAGNL